MIDRFTADVREGKCPICEGPGPVDVHFSHDVISAIVVSMHKSDGKLSCQKCGRKRQIVALMLSSVLGWWGFPYGIIMTPIQIGRNIRAILRPAGRHGPSKALRWLVAQQILSAQEEEAKQAHRKKRREAREARDADLRRPVEGERP